MKIDYLAHHNHFVTELACWHFAEWSHLRPDETIESRTERLLQRCGAGGIPSVFIAFDGPTLFGSATLFQHGQLDRLNLEAWLANVYVTPSMRRKGIGAALVSAVEAEARQSNITRLCLFTTDFQKYYERRGWTFVDQFQGQYELQTVMALDLAPAGVHPGPHVFNPAAD